MNCLLDARTSEPSLLLTQFEIVVVVDAFAVVVVVAVGDIDVVVVGEEIVVVIRGAGQPWWRSLLS